MLDSGPRSRVYAGDTKFKELAMEALGIGQLAKRGGLGIDTVRDGLETIITACPGRGWASDCPILRALTDEEENR
jgi:hypothetical protein